MDQQPLFFIDTSSTINIIPDPLHSQLPEAWEHDFNIFPQTIEDKLGSKIFRLNYEKLRVACQIIGCKANVANSISNGALRHYATLVRNSHIQPIPVDSTDKYLLYIPQKKFTEVLKRKLAEHAMTKQRSILDFEIALNVIEQTKSMIVLIGGTSGSGKSTAASLLGSKFGISSVLSTDSIRHIMRNFMTTDEAPVLFASTYEAGKKITVEEGTSDKKRAIMGFKQQGALVQERLSSIIQGYHSRGESVIIEGVHLTPDFMAAMLAKYNNCLPFLVYISSEAKHRERFAVRSKYMTLEKKHNKYVQNFMNIVAIQKHLVKMADQYLIPKVNNSNIDKSVGIIHRTIIRCLRRIAMGETLYDPEKKNALKIYNQFNEVTKNIWSSETVKQYINTKMSKANKAEIIEKFLSTVAIEKKNIENDNEEGHIDETYNHGDIEEKDDDIEINDPEEKAEPPQGKFKEDLLFKEETKEDKAHQKPRRPKKSSGDNTHDKLNADQEQLLESKKNGVGVAKVDETFMSLDEREMRPASRTVEDFIIPLKASKTDDEDEGNENISPDRLIVNDEEGFKTDTQKSKKHKLSLTKTRSLTQSFGNLGFLHNNNQIKFTELETLLDEKKVISVKGVMSQYYLKKIRRFINYYNKKYPEFYLKLYPHNDRYVICKKNRVEMISSPFNKNIGAGSETTSKTPFSRFKVYTFSQKQFDSEKKAPDSAKRRESGQSDGDFGHSEDDASMSDLSKEKNSSVSGSMDATFYMTGKGSNAPNLSDTNMDLSDEVDSEGMGEQGSEDRTSLQLVESGNSISEQTDEEDDEEEDEMIPRTPKIIIKK